VLQPAQRDAFVMQPDAMRKLRPWERLNLLDIVQEFDKLEGTRANLLDLFGLVDSVKIAAHVMDAATLGRHYVIEAGEVAHKEGLGGGGFGVEAAISHWLSAARLVARVDDLMPEALQKFESRDPNFREEGVDETGDEEAYAHRPAPLVMLHRAIDFAAEGAKADCGVGTVLSSIWAPICFQLARVGL
jgi:hypothetical protein